VIRYIICNHVIVLAFQGKLLSRAIEICGGRAALCARVGVNEHVLKMWLDGRSRIPDQVFLVAADIVLDDDIARASADRRRMPRIAAIPGTQLGESSGAPEA